MNRRMLMSVAVLIAGIVAAILLWQVHPLATVVSAATTVGVLILLLRASQPAESLSIIDRLNQVKGSDRQRSTMPAPGHHMPPASVRAPDRQEVPRQVAPEPQGKSAEMPAEKEAKSAPPPAPSAPPAARPVPAPAPAIPAPAAPISPPAAPQPIPPEQWQNAKPSETAPDEVDFPMFELEESGAEPEPEAVPPKKMNPPSRGVKTKLEQATDNDDLLTESDEREESAAEPEPVDEFEDAEASVAPLATFFTAYYARESAAEHTQGLYVYAHLQNALAQIGQDVRQFIEQLGGEVPRPAAAQQSTTLAIGTALTVMPEAEGLEFDPVAITRKWQPPFTRFDFHYRAPAHLIGEIVTGRIAILVAGIEIAHIKFATMIEAAAALPADAVSLPENPLAAAKLSQTDPTPPYNRIFISYSRKDKIVADNYRLAQIAAGNDVFMDTYSIRAGEDWRVALANAIDSADIFQLFWSPNSAASENVRHEWDYALQFRCPQDRCTEFIRPVFWVDPMPAPPTELSHLNFRRVPFQTD